MQWKVLDHPPHSLDLSPCEFHVFNPLKKALKSRRFWSDEDNKAMVVQWFQQQPREFFVVGILRLVHQWDACLSAHRDYFNGVCSFTQNNPQMEVSHNFTFCFCGCEIQSLTLR
jgi:hypothetical protein